LPHVICYLSDGWQGRLMTRRLSMTTQQELMEAVRERYRRANRDGKRQILDTPGIVVDGIHRSASSSLQALANKRYSHAEP
jgi:hypothetical protein